MPDQDNCIVDVKLKISNTSETPKDNLTKIETAVNGISLNAGESVQIETITSNEAR
jgi:hypothetical protein